MQPYDVPIASEPSALIAKKERLSGCYCGRYDALCERPLPGRQ